MGEIQQENELLKKRVWGPEPRYPKILDYHAPFKGLLSIAGPCSIESEEQIAEVAVHLGFENVKCMRGGIFRAGTYPGDNFGLIDESLIEVFSKLAHKNNMKCVLEVLDYSPYTLGIYMKYADIFQVGARQMQNYRLLHLLAKDGRPVFLKRNMGANVHEWLGAGEHLLKNGTSELFLIERGSSSFMNHVRWDLSISAIAVVKEMCKVPVIVDASHGTGRRDLVAPLTYAGIAAGADGYLIETHPNPEKSLSDSEQAISLEKFSDVHQNALRLKNLVDTFREAK